MSENNGSVEYRQVVGFPDYEVGSDGTVWSNKGKCRKELKQNLHVQKYSHNGYYNVKLSGIVDGKRVSKTTAVHRIVITAFKGPKPVGTECRHIDGNSKNNRAENLEWGTPKQNTADLMRLGIVPTAELTFAEVREIREAVERGESKHVLAAKYNVRERTIRDAACGRTWKTADGRTCKQKVLHGLGESSSRATMTNEQVVEMRNRAALGESVKLIAQHFGVSVGIVRDALNGKTYATCSGPIRQTQPRARMFTDDEVRDIRKLRADGISVRQIAAKYNSEISKIYDIINRTTYKHVLDHTEVSSNGSTAIG